MRERRRRHDDAHFPMGGRGKRATPPKSKTKRNPWDGISRGTSGGLSLPRSPETVSGSTP